MGYTSTTMFSGPVIGILVGLSVATWVYTWAMRRTGDNAKSAAITGILAGIGSFIIIITIVATIDQMLGN